MDENRNLFNMASLRDAMKYFEEHQRKSALLSRRILMNSRDHDQWVKSMPEGFIPDPRIVASPLIPEGQVYGVPDQILYPEINRPAEIRFDLSDLTPYTYTTYRYGRLYAYERPTRKLKKWTEDNPNWSMEWDDWRNREDYKAWRIYRIAMRFIYWLLRRKMPIEAAAPAKNDRIPYDIPV